MHRALGLLLLAAEGGLAQSREPSQWDANVAGYGNVIVDGCPCTNNGTIGTDICSPDNAAEEVKQTETSAMTATFASRVSLKYAYLTDQDGTILDYRADDTAWEGPASRTVRFTWDASKQPTGIVPHIVYKDSCAVVTTSVVTSTWRTKLELLTQKYDVGNSPGADTTPPNQILTDGKPEIAVADITLHADWFNYGVTEAGTFKATFPIDSSVPGGTNAAWLKNQDGTILSYKELPAPTPLVEATPFPRGSVDLHACRLFKTKKLCTTASISAKYINKIEGLNANDVGTYSTTNTAFKDAFTGHYDSGSGRTSIAPKSSDCTQYVMYAKNVDDDGSVNDLLGFGFDKALNFAATSTMKYKVYLTCDGTTLTTGTMDLAVFSSANSVFSVQTDEVQVGYPKCVGDRVADNTSWFEVDGRDCMCDKGTLFCKKAAPGSYFLMNEGESVGLALSVSLIVLLLLCGGIFLLLKKSAQSSEKTVVLKENAQAAPEDRL